MAQKRAFNEGWLDEPALLGEHIKYRLALAKVVKENNIDLKERKEALQLTKIAVKEMCKTSLKAASLPETLYKTTNAWFHSLYDCTLNMIEKPWQLREMMEDDPTPSNWTLQADLEP